MVCNLLSETGVYSILIKPKRNAIARSKGSQALRRMILNYVKDRKGFLERYDSPRQNSAR
ncbi:MAG: hypothetical protein QXF24_06775 [Thermoproteota archaeon]